MEGTKEQDSAVLFERIIAAVIDLLVMVPLVATVAAILGVGTQSEAVFVSIILVGYFSYYIVPEWLYGRTLGKQLLGIIVLRSDGRVPSLEQAVLRNLLRIIDGAGGYLFGLLVILFTNKNQRVGDLLSGTVVVSRR
ncbi:RDD family protein [Natronomonas gomsonensis]|uniref:RDD family protein n=1 Tax=Natronomonas gomsonensis TaxID=1046043 RepID=UPI0015C0290B|nr:RDD family protein [Natronomonas gomsonensis]